LLREALDADLVTQGEEQPGHTATLHNLAGLCAATGREAEALTLFEKIGAIEAKLLPMVMTMVSESGRVLYLQTVQENAEKHRPLLVQQLGPGPEAARAGLDLALARKALWIDALAGPRLTTLVAKYPDLEGKLTRLVYLGRQLVARTWNGPGNEG